MSAFKASILESLKSANPEAAKIDELNDEAQLTMKITKVSVEGIVTIKFNKDVYGYSDLDTR